ncbi:aspartate/glutamate racemase family protein [Acuticoccus sp. I52.16.1]|uniref:aspartate/glutamate racemase family protein n=1 Tax=Acuticoccus sp. I52.16.1 TaxID=2928472 RepID=UPI001FD39CED|nr:aspartate/glutamate racemase family protein [Acuticoccus sp. I52.16.1]UOM37222.1 aspartate/glutamate racemase family protein [Acuticoccus sp. I52.16.1]
MRPPHTILYQLVAPMEVTAGPEEIERRRAFLERYAAAGTAIDVRSVARGTAGIESHYDAALVVPHLIDSIEGAGADAVIVGCFSDPGLDPVRERLDVPVIGPGEAAMALALQLGDRFSVISPGDANPARVQARVRHLGLSERYASCRGMGLRVPELANRVPGALERIETTARACLDDGADVLVLGCMSMAFLGLSDELQARLGVPIVNPVVAGLKTAEAMLSHGITQSRRTWPTPPDKPLLDRASRLETTQTT